MLQKSKKQISKDLLEENLFIEGRIERRARQGTERERTQAEPKKHSLLYGLLAALTGAVGYSVFVSYSQINIEYITPLNNPQVSLSSITPTQADIMLVVPSAGGEPSAGDEASMGPGSSSGKAPAVNKQTSIPTASELAISSTVQKAQTPYLAASNLVDMDEAIFNVYSAKNLDITALAPEERAWAALSPLDVSTIKDYGELSNSKQSLARLFGLSVKTIVIDPGHGGRDPGAIGKEGTYEKDIALEIGKRLQERLKTYKKYNVLLTRSSDQSVSLRKRVEYANNNFADLFISIHVNYFPSEKVNFVETYYFGPTTDHKTEKLAEQENANSHYVYAEFKDMIQKIGDTMKFQESKKLAVLVQNSLYKEIRKISTSSTNHGIKPAPFVVLLGLDAPSILTEVTSLNNQAEEKRLNSPAYRDKIAKFLENGIVSYLNKKATLGEKVNGHEEKENLTQTKATP